MYRGAASLSARLTEAAFGLETALQAADSSSEVRKVLDKLYAGIAVARDLRPHLLTYAEAIFKGAACPASCTEPRCSLLRRLPVHNLRMRHSLQGALCFRHRLTVTRFEMSGMLQHIVNRKRLLSVWDSGLEARSGCCLQAAVVNGTCVQHLQNEILWSMATSSCALLPENDEARRWH
jgi:hypothetical protein